MKAWKIIQFMCFLDISYRCGIVEKNWLEKSTHHAWSFDEVLEVLSWLPRLSLKLFLLVGTDPGKNLLNAPFRWHVLEKHDSKTCSEITNRTSGSKFFLWSLKKFFNCAARFLLTGESCREIPSCGFDLLLHPCKTHRGEGILICQL